GSFCLHLWCRGRESCVESDGDQRCLSRRRHRPKASCQIERRHIYESLYEQGTLQAANGEHPSPCCHESIYGSGRRGFHSGTIGTHMSSTDLDAFKRAAALKAVDYVKDGMVVGLGTGSTAKHMVIALGEKVRAGMSHRGVPTSQETASLAKQCGITLIDQD